MFYDLHVHTTASDGLFSPREVVKLALQVGLAGIAITDHDTTDGLEEGLAAGREMGLTVLPGIELNTDYMETEVHILGYCFQIHDERLSAHLQAIKRARETRGRQMVDKLQDLGYGLEWEEVVAKAGQGVVGRPHIAQVMIEHGWVSSIEEAFARFLGRGKPAYVPRYHFLPREAIDLVHAAGGIAVLAHPGLIKAPQALQEIREQIEGVEAFYPEHSPAQEKAFYARAQACRQLVTGGSDFHGTPGSRNHLGQEIVTRGMIKPLLVRRSQWFSENK